MRTSVLLLATFFSLLPFTALSGTSDPVRRDTDTRIVPASRPLTYPRSIHPLPILTRRAATRPTKAKARAPAKKTAPKNTKSRGKNAAAKKTAPKNTKSRSKNAAATKSKASTKKKAGSAKKKTATKGAAKKKQATAAQCKFTPGAKGKKGRLGKRADCGGGSTAGDNGPWELLCSGGGGAGAGAGAKKGKRAVFDELSNQHFFKCDDPKAKRFNGGDVRARAPKVLTKWLNRNRGQAGGGMKTKAAEYPRKHYNQKNTQGGADPSNDLVPSAELAPLERTYGKLQFIEDTIMPNGGEWDGNFQTKPDYRILLGVTLDNKKIAGVWVVTHLGAAEGQVVTGDANPELFQKQVPLHTLPGAPKAQGPALTGFANAGTGADRPRDPNNPWG